MKTKRYKCYCCDEIGTTKEHAPARCFFPSQKDIPSSSHDYRKNLIKVPSCKKHNNERSKDDEYTAISIILHSENDIACSLLQSKWVKALCRKEASLGKMMFAKSQPVVVPYLYGDLVVPQKTLAMTYDRERIDNVIKSIAYALFYHESKYLNKWLGNWAIRSPNFLRQNLSRNRDYKALTELTEGFDLAKLERKGEHPEIFFYQILQQDNQNWTIKMVFYESMIFFAFPES